MSKAGVMTIPRCAKYSEELAVATCENRGGRSSGPSFGFGLGIHRSYQADFLFNLSYENINNLLDESL